MAKKSETTTKGCSHKWAKVHEACLIGGAFPTGWQCQTCDEFVPIGKVPVTGLGGIDTGKHVLFGPHGGKGQASDGSLFKKQILHPDGKLEMIR